MPSHAASLLETARAYALEKLREANETEQVLRSHARAMLELFENCRRQRWTAPVLVRLERCRPEIDDLRAALDWAAHSEHDAELHIALAGSSSWIWLPIGNTVEGRRRCTQALKRVDGATPSALEAHLQAAWAHLARRRVELSSEKEATERAISLFRGLGLREDLFLTLGDYAVSEASSHRFATAEQAFVEMVRLHDSKWPPFSRFPLAFTEYWLVRTKQPGAFAEARRLAEQLVSIAEDADDAWSLHRALILLNLTALYEGRFEEAVARGRDILASVRGEPQVQGNLALALIDLCYPLTELGEVDEALNLAREASVLFAQAEAMPVMLDQAALLAFKRGNVTGAALASSRSETYFESKQVARLPHQQRAHDKVLAELRNALSIDELVRLQSESATLNDEDAVRIALLR